MSSVSLGSLERGVLVFSCSTWHVFRFVRGEVTLVWTACALPEIMALRRETTVSIV
jgi:hypothetical protein